MHNLQDLLMPEFAKYRQRDLGGLAVELTKEQVLKVIFALRALFGESGYLLFSLFSR